MCKWTHLQTKLYDSSVVELNYIDDLCAVLLAYLTFLSFVYNDDR